MDVSIIIVNWNSAEYAAASIGSIRKFSDGLRYEVIVVDNASSDSSTTTLRKIPGIHFIASPVNLGFAGANNLGFRLASGRAVLFLNPDTLLTTPAVRLMYEFLQSDPSVGVVGARQLNADLSLQKACIQTVPTLVNQIADSEWLRRRFPRARLWGTNSSLAYNAREPIPVDAVSGACIMVRRTVLESVGAFSTDYFMYAEDVDLCYRIAQSGWKIVHVPAAQLIHYGGKSSEQRESEGFASVATCRSVYDFFRKQKGTSYAFVYRVCMGGAALTRLAILAAGRLISPAEYQLRIRAATKRWRHILHWCVGIHQWDGALKQCSADAAHKQKPDPALP